MIDPYNNWVYLHPPKTGGTSIEVALINHALGKQRTRDEIHKEKVFREFFVWGNGSNQHWPLDRMLVMFPFIRDWRKFATVRHPYTRAISEFRYQLSGQRQNPNTEERCYKDKDINEVIETGQLFRNCWSWHSLPQSRYVGDGVELIRFENLSEDFTRVTGVQTLPHHQKSHVEGDWELSDEAKEQLQIRWPHDFEELGYER